MKYLENFFEKVLNKNKKFASLQLTQKKFGYQ